MRQCFDAPPPELLFIVALHGRQKCLGQYDCVLHQICRIKNQTASSCFAMQHGQAMRQTQYPGGRGAEAVGQVIAVVQKAVGGVRAAATLGPREFTVLCGINRQFKKCFGELCLVREQGGHIGCSGNPLCELPYQRLQTRCVHRKAGLPQWALEPLFPQALQARGL